MAETVEIKIKYDQLNWNTNMLHISASKTSLLFLNNKNDKKPYYLYEVIQIRLRGWRVEYMKGLKNGDF